MAFMFTLAVGMTLMTDSTDPVMNAPPGVEQPAFATADAGIQINDVIISPEESMYPESPVNTYVNPNYPEGVELWLGPAVLSEYGFMILGASDCVHKTIEMGTADGTINYQVFTSSGGMAETQG